MKHITNTAALILRAMFMFFVIGAFIGCGGKSDNSRQEEAKTHLKDAGHEHKQPEKEKKAEPETGLTRDEILSARCEHGKPTHECAECRYEVGVVLIDPALIKTEAASTNGLIRIEKASKQTLGRSIEVTGEVRLNENESAHIIPRIDGVIHSVCVDLGKRVSAGDTLFEINSVELGNALNEYIKFQALADIVSRTYEREKKLYEQKISSEQEMLMARAELEKSEADRKAVEHKLHVMGVNDQELSSFLKDGHDKQTGRLSVRSPINGVVIEKHATAGELAEVGKDVMLVANL
ncbi:MAG: efflux RND transporter periplasmic adaptor subunit, partial [Kiritimatiellia bacterium]|nr:efflux RND transporter periplasmic adaptor subunit [Kiritimatiellia bacterium]